MTRRKARPTYRTSFARKGVREEIQELKAAHRDPADLDAKVAAYKVYLDLKKKGVLPMYQVVNGGMR